MRTVTRTATGAKPGLAGATLAALLSVSFFGLPLPAGAQQTAAAHGPGMATGGPIKPRTDGRTAPLLDGLGRHAHPVTTRSPLAQQFFNQGLVLTYGFNHAEAIRSFKEAARLDPGCAMAYWGVALALGPNLNAAMDNDAAKEAYAAIQQAARLASGADPRERALIAALAKRYAKTPGAADRKTLNRAYADAMREVARQHPDDPDAGTLFADALMNTMPWDYWTKDGKPKPGTEEVLRTLEAVLAKNPDHPGANHLYIHAVEASSFPEKALPSAHRLADLVPAAGHLVHMPAHIYVRVGMYHEASLTNERSIRADEAYLTQCRRQGLYPMLYFPHNHHFLWYAATMEGASEKALAAAEKMTGHVDKAKMREPGMGGLQHFAFTPLYAKVRFGRWDEILALPAPEKDLLYPTALWHYARGMALARKGKHTDARQELDKLTALAGDKRLEGVTIMDLNPVSGVLAVAREVLAGEIAGEQGDWATAIRHLEKGVELEEALNYDEPPAFAYPVRQSLGAVLLAAGRPGEAEKVYRDDLRRNPENGWSLFGLLQSLRALGNTELAGDVERRFREAWKHADVTLTSSRF